MPPAGLTERRMLRTREQLLEVAAAMFAERGFDATTVDDIAAAVEVSPRTVYRYFATKEELVLAISQTGWDTFLDVLRNRPPGEPTLAAMRAAVATCFVPHWAEAAKVRGFLDLVASSTAVRARWMEQTASKQAQLAEVLAQRAGRSQTDLQSLIRAGAVTMAINTALQQWYSAGETDTPAPLVDRALRQLATPLLAS